MDTSKKSTYIHLLIVALLAFGFRFVPPIGQITPYGMGILGTFIAAVYGWSTVGMIWPSLICLMGIGLSVTVNGMVASAFNATIMAMMFCMFLMDVLDNTGAVNWLITRMLGSKATKGKPWMTLIFLFLVAYIGGVLNSMIMAIVFVGVFTNICKSIGATPYSKFTTMLMIGVALSVLFGQIGIPVMGNALMIVASYNAMFPEPLNFAKYMMFMIPMGLILIIAYVGIMRFIFRVDVSPLKNYDPSIMGEVKPATRDQKWAFFFFVLYMVLVVVMSLPLGKVSAFLNMFGMFGIIMGVIAVMMILKREDGTPLLDFRKSATKMGWDPVLMVGFIMVISTFMNKPETGISATLMSLLMPFTQLSPFIFIVVALLFAAVLTNIATNLIVIVLVMPVIYNFALMIGMNVTGVMCLLFFAAHLAICTPAAAPPSGIIMTAQEIIKPTQFMKYAVIVVLLEFVVLLAVGIPFSSIIF